MGCPPQVLTGASTELCRGPIGVRACSANRVQQCCNRLQGSHPLSAQAGAARALCYVREHCLQSGSSDGSLHVWDVRYAQQALRSLHMPDTG